MTKCMMRPSKIKPVQDGLRRVRHYTFCHIKYDTGNIKYLQFITYDMTLYNIKYVQFVTKCYIVYVQKCQNYAHKLERI